MPLFTKNLNKNSALSNIFLYSFPYRLDSVLPHEGLAHASTICFRTRFGSRNLNSSASLAGNFFRHPCMTFDRFRRDIWPRLKTFPIVSSTLVYRMVTRVPHERGGGMMLATYNCITLIARCMRHARTLRYRFIVLLIIPLLFLKTNHADIYTTFSMDLGKLSWTLRA